MHLYNVFTQLPMFKECRVSLLVSIRTTPLFLFESDRPTKICFFVSGSGPTREDVVGCGGNAKAEPSRSYPGKNTRNE